MNTSLHRSLAILLLPSVLFFAGAAIAQPPEGSPDGGSPVADSDVSAWIEVLAERICDRHDVIRNSARDALAAMGRPALPALKKLAEGEDAANAHAARDLIRRIESDRRGVGANRRDPDARTPDFGGGSRQMPGRDGPNWTGQMPGLGGPGAGGPGRGGPGQPFGGGGRRGGADSGDGRVPFGRPLGGPGQFQGGRDDGRPDRASDRPDREGGRPEGGDSGNDRPRDEGRGRGGDRPSDANADAIERDESPPSSLAQDAQPGQ